MALISVFFIDKPLALYIHREHFSHIHWLMYVTEYSPNHIIIPFCILMLFIFRTKPAFGSKLIILCYLIAIFMLTMFIKTKLKIAFGRTWPETWHGSGVYGSLIQNHNDSFHLFKLKTWPGSFPSGHATFISLICVSMFLILERFKFLWLSMMLIMEAAILLLNYHYLGDFMAGLALGTFMAYNGFAVYLFILSKFYKQKSDFK